MVSSQACIPLPSLVFSLAPNVEKNSLYLLFYNFFPFHLDSLWGNVMWSNKCERVLQVSEMDYHAGGCFVSFNTLILFVTIQGLRNIAHRFFFSKLRNFLILEESEKVGLKLNVQKTKIMASGPITSWQIDGDTVADFIFLESKITAFDDCSHEIIRRLLLGRKVMPNLDSILKSRDIMLSTKVHLVKAMVFPVVMYRCESWAIKKAECRRIDAFEMWCWRRLLRVLWTSRRSKQSVLKRSVLSVHWKD